MNKQIIAINTSPRKGWNTSDLVCEAARGAESEGAQIEVIDLYRLEKFTGCISCFACKLEPNRGKCICKDGLAPVLEKIRTADGLILGTANYLGSATAGFQALYERLVFQSITYNREAMCCNTHPIPVLFIMTSNAPEDFYLPEQAYGQMLSNYQNSLNSFVGPVRTLIYGNTLQVKNYDRYDWTLFNPEEKMEQHEKIFPEKKIEAFQLGARMVSSSWN